MTNKKQDGRKNNGGPGRNQGRKKLPPDERKVLLGVFVKRKIIKKRGGERAAKELILKFLEAE
jgi:hypothetical protein